MRVNRPLRVLSISHTAVSRIGGRLRHEVLAATHPEIETHLVVPNRWFENGRWMDVEEANENRFGIHISQVRWPRAGPAKWYMHHYPELRALVQSIQPEVIHLWEEPWGLVALHAVNLRNRFHPASAIVLEVDQNILKRLPPPFEHIRSHVLRNTDFIVGRSQDAIQVVQAKGYKGPATLIGYGIDEATFRPLDCAACRQEFGIGGFVVGYAGRLIVEKGLDDVLEALARCSAPVSLAVLGEGPHKEELARHVSLLGLGNRVRFFPWAPPEKVARFMNALDVALLVTRTTGSVREQFGRTIIEAHSCGTPVIGSSSGAIPDVVGEGGWIVPERDASAIASLLDVLARDPHRAVQAGLVGRQQALCRFSYKNVAETLVCAWNAAHEVRANTARAKLYR